MKQGAMNNARWICILALVAFAACSDDDSKSNDDDADTTLTGTFVDGPVAGLHYTTATHSGLTNAEGEFAYEEGETVTFAVGGVTLGSASGAARITPFDLFGIAPPTTALEIRRALQNEGVTAFDRAANVAFFLQSLDNDNDSANGIDLADWNDELANAALSFEWRILEFVGGPMRAFARMHGVQRELGYTDPLRHLYDTLGIAVAGNAPTESRYDETNDGTPDSISRHAYDAAGRNTVTIRDNDADSDDDARYVSTYDAIGQLVTERSETDADDNNTDFEDYDESVHTYDAFGRRTLTVRTSVDSGTTTRVMREVRTFEASGRLTTEVTDTDNGADGTVDARDTTTYTYDASGRLTQRVRENDSNADGVASSRETTAYTYDAANRVATIENSSDYTADGVLDTRSRTSTTYDAAGRKQTEIQELLAITNGMPLSRSTQTLEYDAVGRRASDRTEADTNADGVPNRVQIATYTYNAAGRLTVVDSREDDNGDGTDDRLRHEVRTYDDAGNLTQSIDDDDYEADGDVNYSARRTQTFDSEGNATSTVYEYDSDGNGVYDYGSRNDTEYGPILNVLEQILTQFLLLT